MKYSSLAFLLLALLLPSPAVEAQTQADTYVWPKDPQVQENLKKWQGNKFGILIHFGLYSHMGIVESWGLCPEDVVPREGYSDYCSFASDYRQTKAVFNPVNLDPAKWAKAFQGAGAKYVIFSAKHHDGFCMYDSHETDFKVTDKGCPFSANPKANVTREVFNACRGAGLSVGAYFSKPDWTSTNFWWPYYPPKDRNPNYDTIKHSERWKGFVSYTQNQLREITSEYGRIDILWLDGCWVRPLASINKDVEEFCKYPHDLNIDMPAIASMTRSNQPGMLIVDRWVPSPYEDYLTPEQKTPEKPVAVPWESCITMGENWGWVPNEKFKSTTELVQTLVKIVAKGGNLLLGVGPDGKGEFEPQVYERLSGMGQWLKVNGESIYETVPVEPYQVGKIAYTAKGSNTVYAIYLPEKDEKELPESLTIQCSLQGNVKVSVLGSKLAMEGKKEGNRVVVSLPKEVRAGNQDAVVIKVTNL